MSSMIDPVSAPIVAEVEEERNVRSIEEEVGSMLNLFLDDDATDEVETDEAVSMELV